MSECQPDSSGKIHRQPGSDKSICGVSTRQVTAVTNAHLNHAEISSMMRTIRGLWWNNFFPMGCSNALVCWCPDYKWVHAGGITAASTIEVNWEEEAPGMEFAIPRYMNCWGVVQEILQLFKSFTLKKKKSKTALQHGLFSTPSFVKRAQTGIARSPC